MPARRRLLAVGTAILLVAGCDLNPTPTPTPTPQTAQLRLPDATTLVLESPSPAGLAAQVSQTFFVSAPVAVVAQEDDLAAQLRAASIAVALGAPMLLQGEVEPAPAAEETAEPTETPGSETTGSETPGAPADVLLAELQRLGATSVITVGRVELDGLVTFPAPTDDADLSEMIAAVLGQHPQGTATAIPPLPTVPVGPAMETGETEVAVVAGLDRETPQILAALWADPAPATPVPTPTEGEEPARLPLLTLPQPLAGPLVVSTGDPFDLAAAATARAAGVPVHTIASGDPRRESADVQLLAQTRPAQVVALGLGFGTAEVLERRVATAATGVELPGGGQLLFPGRRFIALYGTPHYSALGSLGEQELSASIERAQNLAAEYQGLTDDTVIPAFEIIVTVAHRYAGDDGNYSTEFEPETFLPWIEAAQEAGVYVMLDLQPGRTDFLTQAKLYEELLLYPNVGLALDPEWRLKRNQVHLAQIGRVDVDEVNEVGEYLATLTREHNLPQKLFMVHQFTSFMIENRERLNTSYDELAVMIHVDGFGAQGSKLATWRNIRDDAPEGLYWGWKNFIDEDRPMATPAQTYRVDPMPEFVSYQ